jgi:CHC2-type zinc finger protein
MPSSGSRTSPGSELPPIRPVLEYFGFKNLPAEGSKFNCLFHDDARASAVAYRTYFKCFACGVEGDAVKLIHDQEGVSWREAHERAESLAGEEHREVPAGRRSGSTLPGGTRPHRGHRAFVPPRLGR